jgi:hypothetical protein
VAAAAAYTPTTDATVIEWWDPATLANGAVASWAGGKGVATLAQGTGANQPVKSATSLNSTPGVTFDGVDDLLSTAGLGATLAALAVCTLTFVATDATTGFNKVLLEYGPNPNANVKTFGCLINGAADRVGSLVLGTGTVAQQNTTNAVTLATATVVSIGFDVTVNTGIAFIRVNGAAVATTSVSTTTPAASWSSQSIFVGARSGAVLPWPGTLGCLVLRNTNSTTGLLTLEQYVGAKAGLTI